MAGGYQWLGEDVSKLLLRTDVVYGNFLFLLLFPDEVVSDLDVFGFLGSWSSGFFTIRIELWLSQKRVVGSLCLTPSALRSRRIHTASFVDSLMEPFSESVVDRATQDCRRLRQVTAAPLSVKTYPVVERLVSISPA